MIWSVVCAVLTGCAAVLLVNATVHLASSPLPRPAFSLGPIVPGNRLDQHVLVPSGGTARMDIWLGTGDQQVNSVPVLVSILNLDQSIEPLHVETIHVATVDPRIVSIRFDHLSPDAGPLVLRLEPAADGPSFFAGATKEDRYPEGRLWIGSEQAFPDQDLAITVYDQIPFSRWLTLAADRQRDQLALLFGLQIATVLGLYSLSRRIQDWSGIVTINLSLASVPIGLLLMIPIARSLSLVS